MTTTIKSVGKTFVDFLDLGQASYTGMATFLLLLSTPVTGYGVSHCHGTWVPVLLVVQSGSAIALWGIPSYKIAKGTTDGVDIIAKERTRISDVLGMLMEELATLANTPKGEFAAQRSRLQSLVLGSAAGLIGPDRARCCFFLYDRVRLPSQASPPRTIWRARLSHSQSAGRTSSNAVFFEGTAIGDPLMAIVRGGATQFVENVYDTPPEGWDPNVRGPYKTFISVGVRAKTTPVGLLSVDSLEVGDLTENDEELLRVFASILATAHTMSARMTAPATTRRATRPEGPPREAS